MGFDGEITILIGLEIRNTCEITEKKERGCNHPDTGVKFCSECGKPMWKTIKEEKWKYDDESFEDIGNIERIESQVLENDDDKIFYYGIKLITADPQSFTSCKIDRPMRVPKQLKDIADKIGLPIEMYVVNTSSC